MAILGNIHKTLFWLMPALFTLCLGCAHPGAKPADIELPAQDAAIYLNKPWQVRQSVQSKFTAAMLEEYFKCWKEPDPKFGLEAMLEVFAKTEQEQGLAENLLPRPVEWYQSLARLADFNSYPNQAWKGLTLDWQNMRLLPTSKPALYGAERPGALMFDSLQQSLLPPNMPVYVHHMSLDGAWLMVQTPIAWGWLPVRGVARLNGAQAARWQSGAFMVFVRDDAVIKDLDGRFLFKAGIGCLFPIGNEPEIILTAGSDGHGLAVLDTATCPESSCTGLPLRLSSANLATVINELLGLPYGWGGRYGNRDCSATLQDLFRVFGLWLPRNSTDQMESGRVIDLREMPDDEKEALVLRQGLPGLSLVHMPGHIMLYLGRDDENAVIFHNVWSLRVENLLGLQDRFNLGRALISDLRPGKELLLLPGPEGFLVNRIDALTLLLESRDLEPAQ